MTLLFAIKPIYREKHDQRHLLTDVMILTTYPERVHQSISNPTQETRTFCVLCVYYT